jgi:cytochrome c biogenesis protein CcmG/thiol:disulfide interchange protein DsbE
MKRFLLPLGVFIALLVFLAVGLKLNPREIPSPFIGKPAPQFHLSQLGDPAASIAPPDMAGQVWLLNVWASWCEACRDEHAALLALSQRKLLPIIGLNYKDQRADGNKWLARFGNPYTLSGFDEDGRVGIDYGVYGVPETFLIDKQGVIRFKFIGVLTPEIIEQKLMPLIKELNRA